MDPLYLETLATLETANGQKTIKGPNGADSNNLYNIKDLTGKGYRAADKAEGSNDAYRVYGSPAESTQDLVGLLSRKYPKALEATSPQEFAQALKDGGYATDPQYVDKFVGIHSRLSASDAGPLSRPDVPVQPAPTSLNDLIEAAKTGKPPKQFAMTKVAKAAEAASNIQAIPQESYPADFFARSTAGETAAKAEAAAPKPGFGDIFPGEAKYNGVIGNTLFRFIKPTFAPQEGYKPRADDVSGYSEEDIHSLMNAKSPEELQFMKGDLDAERAAKAKTAQAGFWTQMGAGAVAQGPEMIATGVGVEAALAKAGLGAVKLAEQGRRVAAFGTSFAEGAAGNVATQAAVDISRGRASSAEEYSLQAMGGLLNPILHAPRILGASRKAEALAYQQMLSHEEQTQLAALAKAKSELGPDATPEAIGARAKQAAADEAINEARGHTAPLREDRKLVSDETNAELMGEHVELDKVPAVEASASKEMTPMEVIRTKVGDKEAQGPLLDAAATKWDSNAYLQGRIMSARTQAESVASIATHTGGRTYDDMLNLPPGVHVTPEAAANPKLGLAIRSIQELAPKYLDGDTVHVHVLPPGIEAQGSIITIGKVHMIALDPAARKIDRFAAGLHEVGHAIWHKHAQYIPADLMAKINKDYAEFASKLVSQDSRAAEQRLSLLNPNARRIEKSGGDLGAVPYNIDKDEYMAEQYVKHLTTAAFGGDTRVSSQLRQKLIEAVNALISMFREAKRAGYLKSDAGAGEFFSRVLDGTLKEAKTSEQAFLDAGLVIPELTSASRTLDSASATEALQRQQGIDRLPGATASQRAEKKFVTELYAKAVNYPLPDVARISKLLTNGPMKALAPTAIDLLTSKNPVARMAAAELIENGAGAAGRRSTASIAKTLFEARFIGNAVNEFHTHYLEYRNVNGGGIADDFFGGKVKDRFNKEVATEIENRHWGRESTSDAAVRGAADTMEAAFGRMRDTQVAMKTPGWAALPPTSVGYMPHRMDAARVREMTPAETRAVMGLLSGQFNALEGFDKAFSDRLSGKYVDIMRRRATAGWGAQLSVVSSEAADIVAEAAEAMGMTKDEAQALSKRVMSAAPAHTRHRLNLDLTQSFTTESGDTMHLMDLFETDHMKLLKSQSGRVSGEAALVRHGIMGSTGLKLMRRSMADFGEHPAENSALTAFDQVAAELLGQPLGKNRSKWVDRALTLNGLLSLGGMGINQAFETYNMATTLGARHALASVGGLARLNAEIRTLAKGGHVDNPLIGSIELHGGKEFGTEPYKLMFPFDSPNKAEVNYGSQELGAIDRLLRSGVHVQAKLSLWRAISTAQERGAAEQIVLKSLRMFREGGGDKYLADMGIDAELAAAFRKELPNVAKFDENGRVVQFDISKMENHEAADAYTQAVWRGSKQIIQGAFIGETGAWVHNDFLRLLTQFRSFSLLAIDKQWNRVVGVNGGGVRGSAVALGILLGSMSFAMPLAMVRVGLNASGLPKDKRDAYLKEHMSVAMLARDSMNYVALSGLAGDMIDALKGASPRIANKLHLNGDASNRSGNAGSALGSLAPVAGKIDSIAKSLQDSKDGTDPSAFLKAALPMGRLPFLIPAVNSLKPAAP